MTDEDRAGGGGGEGEGEGFSVLYQQVEPCEGYTPTGELVAAFGAMELRLCGCGPCARMRELMHSERDRIDGLLDLRDELGVDDRQLEVWITAGVDAPTAREQHRAVDAEWTALQRQVDARPGQP